MKKLIILVAICTSILFFSGCAGMKDMTYNTMNRTEVVLSQNNFKVIGQAEGTTYATYIFGIGGYNKKRLQENAVQQMYKNANLTGSQTIINVNYTSTVKSVLGVYTKRQVTAYGTIIEFK